MEQCSEGEQSCMNEGDRRGKREERDRADWTKDISPDVKPNPNLGLRLETYRLQARVQGQLASRLRRLKKNEADKHNHR